MASASWSASGLSSAVTRMRGNARTGTRAGCTIAPRTANAPLQPASPPTRAPHSTSPANLTPQA